VWFKVGDCEAAARGVVEIPHGVRTSFANDEAAQVKVPSRFVQPLPAWDSCAREEQRIRQ
jgi:hypothetical protein